MTEHIYPLNKLTLYDALLYSMGALGSMVTGLLWLGVGFNLPLSVSIGVNASLLLWAYTLHEGWHNNDE